VGCASQAAGGGSCQAGALSAAAGSFAGPLVRDSGRIGGLVITAAVGGTASVIGGGKFANGAVTAGYGYLFNEVALACRGVGGPAMNHCGLFVYEGDRIEATIERQYSLQGRATTFDPQDSTSSTFRNDRNAFRNGPVDKIVVIAPPEGVSQRSFEENVMRHAESYSAPGYRMGGVSMPNSNSAAAFPIYGSGGVIPALPFSTPGLEFYKPKNK
jgi:hypothetical protein